MRWNTGCGSEVSLSQLPHIVSEATCMATVPNTCGPVRTTLLSLTMYFFLLFLPSSNQTLLAGHSPGSGDPGDKFPFAKPLTHVAHEPFSSEYDVFYHAKQAEESREKPNLAIADVNQPLRDGADQEYPDIGATEEVHQTSAAQPNQSVNKRGLNAADTMVLAPQPKRSQT